MKPKVLHQEAMEYSFKAKQALTENNYANAFDFYKKAAELESQVAEFYFDKPELEPTRSIVIRSAAFLNLKAGLIENAQKFIFFGIQNTKDLQIKEQLNSALEISVSMNNLSSEAASQHYNYLNLLRLRSVNYVIEPSNLIFGHSVTLEMVRDFSESYLKSLKAFAVSKFKQVLNVVGEIDDALQKEIDRLTNPLISNSGYGSFKVSIANDFLQREGEKNDLLELKANVVNRYHSEIFINPLTYEYIQKIKETYTKEEVNDIFKPLTKIKSNNSSYKVGYYGKEDFNKNYLGKIVNAQKKQLILVKEITQEDIGELESSIIHKRSYTSGKISKKTIFKEQLKKYEIDIKTDRIEPNDKSPIILNEDIIITMSFDSNTGFTLLFDDLNIKYTDIEYHKALTGFYDIFYNKLISLLGKTSRSDQEERDWSLIKKLINDPTAFLK